MQALILSLGYVVDVLNKSNLNRFQFGKSRVVQRLQRYSAKHSSSTPSTRTTRNTFASAELFRFGHPTTPQRSSCWNPDNINVLLEANRTLDQKLFGWLRT